VPELRPLARPGPLARLPRLRPLARPSLLTRLSPPRRPAGAPARPAGRRAPSARSHPGRLSFPI